MCFSAHARLEKVDVLHRWHWVSLDLIKTSWCDKVRINLVRLESWYKACKDNWNDQNKLLKQAHLLNFWACARKYS